jgi:voltage-gated sodium channel
LKKEEPPKQWWELTADDVLNSQKFDNFIGMLIAINALTIGYQTDYMARNEIVVAPFGFVVVERIFLVFFFSELSLRLYVNKVKFFYKGSVKWNWFDFLVVMSQLLEEVMGSVARIFQGSSFLENFKLMRLLRVLRLMRVLRVMRVLRLITELRTIVSSIVGSMKSLLWTVVLLVLMMYMVGIYFMQTVTTHLVMMNSETRDKPSNRVLMEYFGSLPRTILTLYQAMSGGFDWDTLADPLTKETGWWVGLAFTSYIAFALLAIMNVVTGVFVQTALQSAKEEEDAFIAEQIVTLFRSGGGDGGAHYITSDEIYEATTNPKTANEWKAINVTPSEAMYLFNLLDIDGLGQVLFEEFLSGCLRLHGGAKAVDVLTLMQELRKFYRAFGILELKVETMGKEAALRNEGHENKQRDDQQRSRGQHGDAADKKAIGDLYPAVLALVSEVKSMRGSQHACSLALKKLELEQSKVLDALNASGEGRSPVLADLLAELFAETDGLALASTETGQPAMVVQNPCIGV